MIRPPMCDACHPTRSLRRTLSRITVEVTMKRIVYAGLVVLSLSAIGWAQARGRGGAGGEPPAARMTAAPEIPFDSIPDFLKLPEGMNLGEVPGVAVNSKGHIF